MASRVSQQDLDASRLVFVSVKDAKPKRKVAVPIPENGSWEQFLRQVQQKLKLSGIDSIYLASTGERVTRLDQLQDIDELQIVEGAALISSTAGPASGNGYNPQDTRLAGHGHRMGTADTEITAAMNSHIDADGDSKYVKRQSSVQLAMKRVFPSLFSQGALPVTTRDSSNPLSPIEQVRRRIRRRRRSWSDPRTLLILFAFLSLLATLAFLYQKAAQGLP